MFLLVIVVVAVVGAAVAAIVVNVRDSDDKPKATTSVCDTRDVAATELLACLGPSLAFVETPISTGSGVLLESKHVVTNAHVIDPYGAVDITFQGGEHHDAVPVVAVDLLHDIALLGPIETTRTGRSLSDPSAMKQGDRLFLVGYPGESDKNPDPTISEGILSRTRNDERFGLKFLQTDASIGGGQSGGALADARGRIVGISGYSFAEQFALALSGADVIETIDRLRAGNGSPYHPIPERGDRTEHALHLEPDVGQVLIIPAASSARKLHLSLTGSPTPAIDVSDLDGNTLAINTEYLVVGAQFGLPITPEQVAAGGSSLDQLLKQFGLPSPSTVPGVMDLDIEPNAAIVITIGTTGDTAQDVNATLSIPAAFVEQNAAARPIKVDDHLDGVIDSFENADVFRLTLRAGERVEIEVAAPNAFIGFAFVKPRQPFRDAENVDGVDTGPVGTEAKRSFTAEAAGDYLVEVYTAQPNAAGYVIEVHAD